MHVCIVARDFPKRSETFIVEHVLGLARRGYRVTVVGRRPPPGITNNELAALGLEGLDIRFIGGSRRSLFSVGANAFRIIVRRPSAIRWLRSRRSFEKFYAAFVQQVIDDILPDVVHVHFGTCAQALYSIGLKSSLVTTWHGYDANRIPHTWGCDAYCSLFCSTWHHTVGSVFMRERLLRLGAKAETLSVIPMGVDLIRFSHKERPEEKKGPLRLISVGRLVEEKGHAYLIQAVSELLDAGVEVELKIIGDGKLWRPLNKQVKNLNRAESIQLMGEMNTDEVIAQLHRADVFCLTGVISEDGSEEGQGLVFAEAQATGLPVIGSSVGGVHESMVNGKTGFLTTPGDIQEIKKAICFFAENPGEIARFGSRARAFVEQRFSGEKTLDQFEAIYHTLRASDV